MERTDNSQSVIKEWLNAFIQVLTQLSEKSESKGLNMGNRDFAEVGRSEESKLLIEELCNEIDEEYELRRELENEDDPETWFHSKTDETLNELAEAGIIDTPAKEDYEKAHAVLDEAIGKGIIIEAEQTAIELNKDESQTEHTPQNKSNEKEED